METETRSGMRSLKFLVRAVLDAGQSPTPISDTTSVALGGERYFVLLGADGFGLLVERPKAVRLASQNGLKWADVTLELLADGTIELVGELKTGTRDRYKLLLTGVRFTLDPNVSEFNPLGDAQELLVVRYEGDRPLEEANGTAQFSGDGTVYIESTFQVVGGTQGVAFVLTAPLE